MRQCCVALCLLGFGCTDNLKLPDAAAQDASSEARPSVVFYLSPLSADGGWTKLEVFQKEILIAPTQHLVLACEPGLKNYRVFLSDESGHVVPSDDHPEESANRLEYSLRFLEALKAGFVYQLVVEASDDVPLQDFQGRTLSEANFTLQVLGEKAQTAPSPPQSRPKKQKNKGSKPSQ